MTTKPAGVPVARQLPERKLRRSALITGIVLGIGIMAFLDETILHQLLQWHTLVWNTDQHGRILSDGIFHAFSTVVLLWGTLRLWRSREMWALPYRKAIVAAILIGAGGFNLYDGIVQHAILHMHLVNELVCSSPASSRDTVLGICRNDIPYELVLSSCNSPTSANWKRLFARWATCRATTTRSRCRFQTTAASAQSKPCSTGSLTNQS